MKHLIQFGLLVIRFGLLGSLTGTAAAAGPGLADLPAVRALLSSLPASLLAEPDAVQARLPFDLVWQ